MTAGRISERMNEEQREGPPTATLEEAADLRVRIEALTLEAECLRGALARRDEDLARQAELLAALASERNDLGARLQALTGSTTWRATAPLRGLLSRSPNLTRLVRRLLKLLWWTITLQLPAKLKARRLSGTDAAPPALAVPAQEPDGSRNADAPAAWYGAAPLAKEQLSGLARVAKPYGPGVYEAMTAAISRRYGHVVVDDGSATTYAQLQVADLARARLMRAAVPRHIIPSVSPARYTVVTPFYRHLDFFRLCAASVAAMADKADALRGEPRLEWIVVNDDPAVSSGDLEALLPPVLTRLTRIISDGQNRGIVARLNQGIGAARHPWILFLDCDDEIEPETIPVLDHYIRLFPKCRYIASTMIDIDEDGAELRPRFHAHATVDLFGHGMVASHLKAIRRDLTDELGGLDPSLSGVQDYDLALKTALQEPILQIPEHLYRYRWHETSQTVARQERQAGLARLARARFLREMAGDGARQG